MIFKSLHLSVQTHNNAVKNQCFWLRGEIFCLLKENIRIVHWHNMHLLVLRNIQIPKVHLNRNTSLSEKEEKMLRHCAPRTGVNHLADDTSSRGRVTVLCGCLVCPEVFQEFVSQLVSLPQQTFLCLPHLPLSCPSINPPQPAGLYQRG